jgi:hypothetical protein
MKTTKNFTQEKQTDILTVGLRSSDAISFGERGRERERERERERDTDLSEENIAMLFFRFLLRLNFQP